MQNGPSPIIHLVHGNEVLTLRDLEARLGNFASNAVLAAGELLAVLAVADGRTGLFVRVVESDAVADFAAVAAPRDCLGHLGGRVTLLMGR